MKRILLKRKSLFLISFAVIFVDQSSKFFASYLLDFNSSITLIPHLIHLNLVKNTGAAFSLFSQSGQILGLLSFCVSIGLTLWLLKSKPLPIWKGLGLAFLLGGCIGNGLDRWRLGYVNDFIELVPINFPIFNGADIAINIAVICLLIETMNKSNSHNPS